MSTAVLSYLQTAPLLQARKEGRSSAATSLDLGLSTVEVTLDAEGVGLPGGSLLDWASIGRISKDEKGCYRIVNGTIEKIKAFSAAQNLQFTLMPTPTSPAMLISGTLMHRIKDMEPHLGAQAMVKALGPLQGRVLDTATGLGYAAIEIARCGGDVVTVEIDPAAQEMARANPWSQGLFDNSRIRQVMGDIVEVIDGFADGEFSAILHDPPTFAMAGDLYSEGFYRKLHRVLTPGGKLFHYIGDPDSKSGAQVTGGAIRRLRDAGFRSVAARREAFGVVAVR